MIFKIIIQAIITSGNNEGVKEKDVKKHIVIHILGHALISFTVQYHKSNGTIGRYLWFSQQ